MSLQAKESAEALTARTDSQGNFTFATLHSGVYTVQAEAPGYGKATVPSLFVGPKEAKNIELALPAKPSDQQPASSPALKFFDQPQFTVSGVTDTTSLGGHGSDTMVRTREAIAKDTVSLGKARNDSQLVAASAKEEFLLQAVEREPRSFAANHQLGELLVDLGKAHQAIPYLQRAYEFNPGDYENAYCLVLANADDGNFERARALAQALLPHNDKAELHHVLADAQEKLGNSLEAVREYQRAAELDPSEPNLFDWGSELLLHHAPEPALEVFAKGNQLFPHSVRMLIGLGAAWFARGSHDQAIERICQASDLDPQNSTPYLFLGKMQSAETTPSAELVEKLRRFATLQPENAQANYYYAVSLWELRKGPQDASLAQVESLLNRAIQVDPKFGPAYLQLGILYAEQRDYPQAISHYQHAIQTTPQLEEAHFRLAQAYRQMGEPEKGNAELQLYDRMVKESAQQIERERHEIRQFVYTLRDQPPGQKP